MNPKNNIIPHNLEAEDAILGRILMMPSELSKVVSILTPNSFHDESNRHIFRAMLELFENKVQIDEVTVGDQLKDYGKIEDIGGFAHLAGLSENAPVSGNIQYWSEIVKDDAMLRDLITIASDITRKARDPQQAVIPLLVETETKIREIASRRSTDVQLLGDVVSDCYEEISKLSKTENQHIGIMLGFEDIDRLIGGLMPGDFLVIGARPSMGKSALLMEIMKNVSLRYGQHTLLFSREMQKKKLGKRAISSHGRINQYFLKTGKTRKDEDWDRLAKTVDVLSNAPVYLDAKTKLIDEMVYKCHALHAQHERGLKLIGFDYIQKILSPQKIREQEIADISGKMKDLAMDLDVPVIAAAQLNRKLEDRSDKRPQMSDLRESGAIEQDADIIGFLYRDEYYNPETTNKPGIAELDFPKVRDGATGMVELGFEGKYVRFSDIPK